MNETAPKESSCPYYIVIDLTKIPVATRPVWIIINTPYFAGASTRTEQPIDAALIPVSDLAQWLYDNQNYISYDKSYHYFECVHHLTDSSMISIVTKAPEICRMSLATMVEDLVTAGCNYAVPSYMHYAELSLANDKLYVNTLTPFSATANCYSIPFLRSISKVNPAVTTTTDIIFKSCSFPGQIAAKVVMSVQTGVNTVKHYDFSQIPP